MTAAVGTRSIRTNTLWLFIADMVNKLFVLAATILIARSIGVEEYGVFGFVFAYITLLGILADFGTATYSVRELSGNTERTGEVLRTGISTKIVLSLGSAVIAIGVLPLLGKSTVILGYVALATGFLIFNALGTYLHAIFRAHENMRYEAWSRIIQYTVLLVGTVVAVLMHATLSGYILAYVVSAFAGFVTAAVFVHRRFAPLRLSLDRLAWKRMLVGAAPIALAAAFVSVYYNIDQVMLSLMKTDTDVGLYNAAYKIITLMVGINVLLMNAGFPVITRLLRSDPHRLPNVLHGYIRLGAIIGLPVAFGGIALAAPVMTLLFGAEYAAGGTALAILLWSVALLFISGIFIKTLVASYRQNVYVWAVGIGAGLNILVNLILIPRYGLPGAAAATVMTEVVILCMTHRALKRTVAFNVLPHIFRPVIAAAAMLGLVTLLPEWNVLIRIVIGAAVYTAILTVIGGVRAAELRALIRPSSDSNGTV